MMKKTKPFQIRFPEKILDQLKAVADSQHTTSSEIVRRLVIDYLKKVEEKDSSVFASSVISTENGKPGMKKIKWADIIDTTTPKLLPEDNPPIDESDMPF